MTMPANNINLITDVRNGFMQDTSGNASLNSQKYRDGAGKGTGNVALTDFANKAFAQGRTIRKTQDGSSISSMKPYCWDQRHDNISHSSISWTLSYESGLPTWASYHSGRRDIPTAAYSHGFFKSSGSEALSISFSTLANQNNYSANIRVTIYGYDNGYLSGNSTTLMSEQSASGSKTFNFNASSYYPYVMISFKTYVSAWNGVLGYETRGGYTIKNLEVKAR